MPQDAPLSTPQNDQRAEAEKAAPDADPLTCLPGTWLADNAFFLERILKFGNEVHGVNGRVNFSFDTDGTFTTEYQDWVLTLPCTTELPIPATRMTQRL